MDLATSYMGLSLRNPLIASASPLNGDVAVLRALEDHGAAVVVLPSIFEEQIDAERREMEARIQVPAIGFAEAQSYFPRYDGYGLGTERYLHLVRRAKASVAIPVIASLNCITPAGWVDSQSRDSPAEPVTVTAVRVSTEVAERHPRRPPHTAGGGRFRGSPPNRT